MTRQPARKRARAGLTRTYQTSRLFLGLSVEDNLYLAVLGVRGGTSDLCVVRSGTAGCGLEPVS